MNIFLQVKYLILDINETSIYWTDFRKNSHNKFHKNPSSKSGVVPRGQTDGQIDVTYQQLIFEISRMRLKTTGSRL